ncbi:MAG: hypothetical protein GX643_16065 [Acidimicrobiales bacterium]|nr:hypothetical protein [Acidimicrobiales bacterium]
MAIDPTTEVAFTVDQIAPATAAVADVLSKAEGWVNLSPEVEPGTEPPRRNLFAAIFSSRGPALPLATVSPSGTDDGLLALGLQHPGGVKALDTLAAAGHRLPEGWRKVSDHPRRGFVVSAPSTTSPDRIVRWLVDGAVLLTDHDLVEITDHWVARSYRP